MGHSGLFITGVGTGVGKTITSAAIAHLLKKNGHAVDLMKPAQTGTNGKKPFLEDIGLIKKLSAADTPDSLASPYRFKAPLSPYHAALKENKKISLKKITGKFKQIQKERKSFIIVEGAGGLMVPLTEKQFWPDLIKMLDIPIVIVTTPALGMIHQTLSTILTAEMYGLDIAGIVIVETDKKKHPDIDTKWLEKNAGCKILATLPFTGSINSPKRFRAYAEKHLPSEPFVNLLKKKENSRLQKKLEKSDRQHIWHPFTQMKEWMEEDMLIVDSASGTKLKDIHGNSYYDGHSSYWVNIHGHSHPKLMRSLHRQSAKLDHATFLGLTHQPAIELAEKLVEITPQNLRKVFYSDNGSTAVEVGIKMSVQYFRQREKKRKPKKTKLMALGEAYHGDTLGAVAVGGVKMYRKIFAPLLADTVFAPSPYCYRCTVGKEFPECGLSCAEEMERIVKANHESIAAFVIEPMVQSPGGIIISPPGYLKRVRDICYEYDIIMIADEVAVGFGRTAKMFACEHENVEPDIMALSKSIGAGVTPLAATLATDEIYNAFIGNYDDKKTFFHGHTFTAHSPACAVALESLKLFGDGKLLAKVEEKSARIGDFLVKFEDLPHVGDIRQLGMIIGIEIVGNKESRKRFTPSKRTGHAISMEARKRGLIVRPLGDIMVLFPILESMEDELEDMVNILHESIAAVTGG